MECNDCVENSHESMICEKKPIYGNFERFLLIEISLIPRGFLQEKRLYLKRILTFRIRMLQNMKCGLLKFEINYNV